MVVTVGIEKSKARKRKMKADPDNWLININKKMRLLGQPYLGRKLNEESHENGILFLVMDVNKDTFVVAAVRENAKKYQKKTQQPFLINTGNRGVRNARLPLSGLWWMKLK